MTDYKKRGQNVNFHQTGEFARKKSKALEKHLCVHCSSPTRLTFFGMVATRTNFVPARL